LAPPTVGGGKARLGRSLTSTPSLTGRIPSGNSSRDRGRRRYPVAACTLDGRHFAPRLTVGTPISSGASAIDHCRHANCDRLRSRPLRKCREGQVLAMVIAPDRSRSRRGARVLMAACSPSGRRAARRCVRVCRAHSISERSFPGTHWDLAATRALSAAGACIRSPPGRSTGATWRRP
jgi:hypothetical protein